MIAILILAALALAYANGSNDNFKATATLYGSRTLDYGQSLRLATAAQLCGSVASVVLAGELLKAFGGKGLVPDAVVGDPLFLAAVGLGAATTVLLATRVGIPISTTHALIGGLTGAGVAIAPSDLAWQALGAKYFLPLLLSPALALVGTATLYPLARAARRRMGVTATTCVCVNGTMEHVDVAADGSTVLASTGAAIVIDDMAACTVSYSGRILGASAKTIVDRLHVISAFSLGFARGMNDTPKILALLVAAGWSGIDPRASLVAVAVAMALGGWLHAGRIAQTMGHRITSMNTGQGMLANAMSSALVIGASLMGSPVSTTHVSTGAIFGIGTWSGTADWRVVTGIVGAWVLTLPIAGLLAAGVVFVAG